MKKIIGAAIGSCVHVAGLHHFLEIAESEGYESISFGPAVSVSRLLEIIRDEKPDIVAVSYRLTPESAARLFQELKSGLEREGITGYRMIFGVRLPWPQWLTVTVSSNVSLTVPGLQAR